MPVSLKPESRPLFGLLAPGILVLTALLINSPNPGVVVSKLTFFVQSFRADQNLQMEIAKMNNNNENLPLSNVLLIYKCVIAFFILNFYDLKSGNAFAIEQISFFILENGVCRLRASSEE
ncbi:hypothetical protein GQX74_013646 [Glossina fuscipes]|nr:hypothetical protein GQX74_013646 [Glossina fuscipes]